MSHNLAGFDGEAGKEHATLCIAVLVSAEAERVFGETYTAARYSTRHSTPGEVFDPLNEALGWRESQEPQE